MFRNNPPEGSYYGVLVVLRQQGENIGLYAPVVGDLDKRQATEEDKNDEPPESDFFADHGGLFSRLQSPVEIRLVVGPLRRGENTRCAESISCEVPIGFLHPECRQVLIFPFEDDTGDQWNYSNQQLEESLLLITIVPLNVRKEIARLQKLAELACSITGGLRLCMTDQE